MLLRAVDSAASIRPAAAANRSKLMSDEESLRNHRHRKSLNLAHEAHGLGFLSSSDQITMNRERVLSDAKASALQLRAPAMKPPVMRTDIPAPAKTSWPL